MAKTIKKPGRKAKPAPKAKAVPKLKLDPIDREIVGLKCEMSFEKVLRQIEVLSDKRLSIEQKGELKWILSHQFVDLVRENMKRGKIIPENIVHRVNKLKLDLWSSN